ncbi:MAG: cellulase family glycosylhydrolase [Clostridia bacterium]|nr:cellulase family glycosylhydrolase [Clostridia bacterium]
MRENQTLFESGRFFTGCNYWASHAGTDMWHNWNAEVVESDLVRLSEANIKVMRMFPRWDDFQPLRMHRGAQGEERELRLGEEPLPFTEAGRAGVDIVMADRFEVFCDLAQKYGIKLIVGLVTGWMSGRMYMPEAFAGRPLLSDPMVMRWQIRFVRYMVRRFKNHPAIAAWDLGNECNCMGGIDSADGAYVWAAAIAGAIKREDPDHPVVSGLHSNLPNKIWRPEDLGENLDILCTHPYPIFTPHCETDPINEMKTILHATAETIMYESLSGKPAFVEEAGTLGPMIADEDVAADFVRAASFSAWAHNLRGYVWWCANEQSMLEATPYDWNTVERELGLFRADGSKKPVIDALTEITSFVDNFEYGALPERITDAVCVLTHGQDVWAAAYGSFILAKQAGLDITFAWCDDEIPQSPAYLLPSLTQDSSIYRHTLCDLLARVEKGATLYMSLNDALLSPFSEITGVKVKTRSRRVTDDIVKLGRQEYRLWNSFKVVLENIRADMIAADQDGHPVFTAADYGKGRVYFLAAPIELDASCKNSVISGTRAIPYYRFYEQLDMRNPEKSAVSDSQYVCVTEHIVSENERLLTILNYTPENRKANIALDGWRFDRLITYHGGSAKADEDGFTVALPGNTGAVAVIKKA